MNVICVLLDTLRRDHLGCYGNANIHTPNLDRFANNGAKFSNAYIGSYPCMPARQDLWTGQLNFFWRGWSPLEYDQEDIITKINQNGNTSMLVTDHYHLWQHGSGNYHFNFNGMELIRGQENDNWITDPNLDIRYPASKEKLNRNWERYARNTAHFTSEEDYFAGQVFQKSMDWVERNKDLDDFFLMIDCFDPHEPFDPPQKYIEMYDPDYNGESIIWPRYGNTNKLTPEELKHVHALYCAEVTYVDHWFGKFYDKLEEQGLLENTMVVVTSDHGFLFGEHSWLGKHARILFQDIARTPLMVNSPEVKAGTEYNELVQMVDLSPTILKTLGIEVPSSMHGKSLTALWNEGDRSADDISSRDSLLFGVFGGPVYCTDGEHVLVKKPVEGNSPLYWYTRSHFQNWDFAQQNLVEDSQKRLDIWNGKRFPVQYENAQPGHAAPRMLHKDSDYKANIGHPQDELYDAIHDHAQERNLFDENDYVREKLQAKMIEGMQKLNVPEEQYTRLGLKAAVPSES